MRRRFSPVLAALLAGCSSLGLTETKPDSTVPQCPRPGIVAEADRLVQRQGPGDKAENVLFEARLVGVGGECLFDAKRTKVQADMKVRMELLRGPAGKPAEVPAAYFIAVVDAKGQIRARQELPVSFNLAKAGGPAPLQLTDETAVSFSLREGEAAESHQILLGWVLSHEQLEENRARRR